MTKENACCVLIDIYTEYSKFVQLSEHDRALCTEAITMAIQALKEPGMAIRESDRVGCVLVPADGVCR